MPLETIGVKAVIEGLGTFTTGISQMNSLVSGFASSAASTGAKVDTGLTNKISQLGARLRQARQENADFLAGLKQLSLTAVAIGGTITTFAALAVKAAIDEQAANARLDAALKAVGTSYKAQRDEIEKTTNALVRNTNYGVTQQTDTLTRLVLITHNYQRAIAALPTVLDVATGLQIDTSEAATLVGKALDGEVTALARLGINLSRAAGPAANLALIQARFNGQAAAAVNPLTQLRNELTLLFAQIGSALLPVIKALVDLLGPLLEEFAKFASSPIAKPFIVLTAAIGALLLILGTLGLALPLITNGLIALGFAADIATGPFAPLALAITGITVAALLLAKNWDKVWNGIKRVTQEVVNSLIDYFNLYLKALGYLIGGFEKLVSWIPGLGRVSDGLKAISKELKQGIPELNLTGGGNTKPAPVQTPAQPPTQGGIAPALAQAQRGSLAAGLQAGPAAPPVHTVVLPLGANPNQASSSPTQVHYNITANYAVPQQPGAIVDDVRAVQMAASR